VKKLNAFRARLTPAQVAEGINAATSNAKRLAGDAATLLAANRFPSAASLAILSIEEAGKVSILREIALASTEQEASESWKNYRSHTRKNFAWILPDLAARGARRLDDLKPLVQPDAEHPYLLDQVKQLGFYTDCLGKAHWSKPIDVISKELAASLVTTANTFAHGGECTAREIELWIEHLKPVWSRDSGWMKQGIINWYAAMQREGLKPEGENVMQQFIHRRIAAGSPEPSTE
jgi:AbiV family abortive infection protein